MKTLNEEKQGLQRQLVDACTHNTKQNLLRSEVDSLTARAENEAQERAAVQAKLEVQQAEVHELQQSVQVKSDKLQAAQADLQAMQNLLDQVKLEVSAAKADKDAAQGSLAELSGAHQATVQEHNELMKGCERSVALEGQLAAASTELEATKAQLEAKLACTKQLESDLQIQSNAAIDLRSERDDVVCSLDRLSQLQHLEASAKQESELRQQRLKQELDSTRARLETLLQQLEEMKDRCAQLEEESQHMDQLKAQLALATQSEDAAHSTLTHLEDERAALSSQIQELQQYRMQLETSLLQSNQSLQHQAAENAALTSQVQQLQQEKKCLDVTADSQAREHAQKLQQLDQDRAAITRQLRTVQQAHEALQDSLAAQAHQHQQEMQNLQDTADSHQHTARDAEANLETAYAELQQQEAMVVHLEGANAALQKQLDEQHNQQEGSVRKTQEVTQQLHQAIANADQLQADLRHAGVEHTQLAADLEKAQNAETSANLIKRELEDCQGLLAAEREHSRTQEQAALQASKKCGALQGDVYSLREAKLEGEYASASQISMLEQEIRKLEADLATSQEAGAGLLKSQEQLQTELVRAAELKQQAEAAHNSAMQLRDHLQDERSKSRQMQQLAEAQRSRAEQLQEQLMAAQAEAARSSVALDSIQAASLASNGQSRGVLTLETLEDVETGASTPSSEERRVMHVAQISEMSLALHEAEVQNLQQQIQLQQDEISQLRSTLEDQAEHLQRQQQEANQAYGSRISKLQQDLNHQASLVQHHQEECNKARDDLQRLEAQHQADVSQLQAELHHMRIEAEHSQDVGSAARSDHQEARAALEGSISELQGQLESTEQDLAAVQRERNSLLHQLATSKRDEGRLQRLQQQCAALEEENTALSDSLASQVIRLSASVSGCHPKDPMDCLLKHRLFRANQT